MKLIQINKKERKLKLVENNVIFFELDCFVGKNFGRKLEKNDLKTPEGEYIIIVKNPKSKFYLSLGLNYPNVNDARKAFEKNIIDVKTRDKIILAQENYLKNSKTIIPWDTEMGGEIYIHLKSEENKNWTRGCINLKTKEDMKKIYDNVEIGTKVVIL